MCAFQEVQLNVNVSRFSFKQVPSALILKRSEDFDPDSLL